MKIVLYVLLVLLLMFSVQLTFGQVAERKVTLHRTGVKLSDLLSEIEAQTAVKFMYNDLQVKAIERATINVDSVSLGDALKELLSPYNISFRIHEQDGRITLKKNSRQGLNNATDNDASFFVTGRVTDSKNNEGMPGVNIIIKGSTDGVTTDAEGRYTLKVNDNTVLVFSSIGYVSYETSVGTRTEIDVELSEDNTNLEEVVINAGYYEVDSKEQTGNISRVTSKQIASQPVSNPMLAIQGRMAGVQITQVTGVNGDGYGIQIRGINSIRGLSASEPLYVVDGIPFSSTALFVTGNGIVRVPSPLNTINPANIESIEVLKDADATAIYGSRGANGVVLITTKKGKAGKTQADFNFYTGVSMAGRQMDMLNTSQYVQMRKEAFRNDGVTPTIANAPDLLLWDTTRYTNWQKVLLGGTAKTTNFQGNLSGGNSSTQFLIGGGYYRQTTVFPGDYAYQKASAQVNISHASFNNKFQIGISGSFVSDNNVLPTTDFSGLVFSLSPNTPQIYDPSGNLNWENGTFQNPYGDMKRTYTTATKNLLSNVNLSYAITDNVKFKTNLGYNYISTDEKSLIPIAAQNPANNPTGTATFSKGSISTWIIEPQLDFQKNLGEGKFNALLGITFQQTLRERQGYTGTGFINDSQLENIAAASTISAIGGDYTEYKYNAIFARVNYNWKERYILNLTARRDGSSRFGPNKRFANFGALGAAWIFSKEEFVNAIFPGLSFGKLRGSVGLTGSDQIGDYQFLDTYSSTTNSYQGAKGLIPSRLSNPDFGWEENLKAEVGLELAFFHDKVFFSGSYYQNRSSNQLVGYSLPGTTGFTSVQSNLPATIENTGVELVISTTNIEKGKFKWTTNFNGTFPRTILTSYPNISSSTYANTYSVDKSLFILKKYKSTGVDPTTGIYTFEDVDNSGNLTTAADAQFIKERSTKFYGGLQNTFTFKQFELQFSFQFVQQTGNNYLIAIINAPGTRGNQGTIVLDRWKNPGDNTAIQRFTQSGTANTAYFNASQNGDGAISDASFIRLQNISLSWNLPSNWSKKIKSEKIRLYCQGQNLFLITNYNSADPETQNVRTLSPLRTVTVGAQLTF